MLKRIFAAITSLAEAIEGFAATFREADSHLRQRLALDHRDEVPALPEPVPEKNGRRKASV